MGTERYNGAMVKQTFRWLEEGILLRYIECMFWIVDVRELNQQMLFFDFEGGRTHAGRLLRSYLPGGCRGTVSSSYNSMLEA